MMTEAFICDAIRTPIGRYGGALSSVRSDDLAAVPIKALLRRNSGLRPDQIDDVILGCANQAGEDNRNVARMALLLSDIPTSVPGVTVNRLCASGLEAIGQAARAIRVGEADLIIAGGVENMSRAPLVMPKADKPFARKVEIYDSTIGWRFINPIMKSKYGVDSMPQTAENLADMYSVGREDQDAFALRSHQRVFAARDKSFFKNEIEPLTINNRRNGSIEVSQDEHPRADTSMEALAGLPSIVRSDGTVTAGSSSGVSDGAAALVVASRAAVDRMQLSPRARILGMTAAGIEPRIMGFAPALAVRRLLDRLNMKLSDIDLIELNEAFASQALAVLRDLGVPDDADFVNPNGGAIALGHPLGMSGARLATTALNQLERVGGRYALCTLCVGVGQGLAMVIERVS